jgi:hypothetical protein
MFNPITALMRSTRRRPVKSRAAPRRAKRTAKHKTKRTKIGSYAGALIAAKPVKMAKAGARIRRRLFGQQIFDNRLWVGANNIQSEFYLFSLIAEGLMYHILKRLGDTRSDKEASVPTSFLTRLQLTFVRDESRAGSSGVVSHYADIDMVQDTSFNGVVYNDQIISFNPVTVDGVAQPQNTGLNKLLFDQAVLGYYPEAVFAFRGVPGSPAALGPEIMRDTQLGRANIKIDIAKTHKFQNVTPATADRGSGTSNYNVNAIDANPLEGRLMTFRNLCPTWNKGWIVRQGSDVNTLENFSGRPRTTAQWDYKQLGSQAFAASGDSLPDINEFEAMPLRPSTIFANARLAGKVRFPPGGFKTFSTKFTYDGSLRTLCRDVTQVANVADEGTASKYPPLGSSFMMCLLPTIKTVSNESITCAYDFVIDGKAHVTKYKGGTMPTTNIIE